MGIYRNKTARFKQSAERLLFAKKDDHLLAPIDICLFEQTASGATFINSNTPGEFIGTEVRATGNVKIGVISEYSVPSVISINPIVKITPDPLLSLSPTLQSFNPIARSQVRIGDQVVFSIDGVRVIGEVQNHIPTQLPFIQPSFTVDAYEVKFKQRLIDIDSVHGARVFYPSTGQILGMLIGSQGTNAIVYPADLIN
ncbi:hypothetical protein [Nostoc sp. 'Peltigera membranacea cyanobiont' N6]|uniref:hypothetical protein n=1 Tax=Nostoc sp. 'Peltigera membranacea cyanobiont' N6 TaxID=1261031 RepID=UPI000CF35C9B|nr:hypothetical protein [Nostoc sp. 'Peltigera membranacea cyanobiont' N6]AVH68510.1 hypothetical protein NPM_50026 [Nostoc sp. 'Peltigera membranacea cyanobiont' N6]